MVLAFFRTDDDHVLEPLRQVRKTTLPEDINDSPETAPSKRILSIFPEGTYSKPEHGPLIAEAIGIDAMRQKCAQFDAWVAHLQAWGN